MSPLLEKLILMFIQHYLTPELVQKLELELAVFLKDAAAKSANKIDDFVVEALIKALGLPVP